MVATKYDSDFFTAGVDVATSSDSVLIMGSSYMCPTDSEWSTFRPLLTVKVSFRYDQANRSSSPCDFVPPPPPRQHSDTPIPLRYPRVNVLTAQTFSTWLEWPKGERWGWVGASWCVRSYVKLDNSQFALVVSPFTVPLAHGAVRCFRGF